MIRFKKVVCLVFVAAFCSSPLFAQERVDHFKGKPAKTLAEAVANFNEANQALRVLVKGELDAENLAKIHQLSYTLENALGKINEESQALAILLEQIHLSSETGKGLAVKGNSEAYFHIVDTLAPGK